MFKAQIAGLIEFATEKKLPIDNLLNVAKGGKKLVGRAAVKEILKQAGVEAAEETISEYANVLTDISIMGDRSEFEQYKRDLMRNRGYSEARANEKAFMEFFVKQPALAAHWWCIVRWCNGRRRCIS